MPYEIFEYDLKILNLQRLLLANPQINLQSIYSIFGSFSDPQEFYLSRKKPMAHDNYPNIMLTEESDGFFKISEFNGTSNKIFNLTSISLSSDTHSPTKKLPTTQQLNGDITSAILAFNSHASSSYEIKSLAEFSKYLKKIKEGFISIPSDVPEFVKEKVFYQFTQHLQENPNPEIPIYGSSYFEREQFKNLEICTIYCKAKEYIKSLPYSSEYKQKISEGFDDLNKQICYDASQKLDKESILKNLSLAVENVNPTIEQQDDRLDDQKDSKESDPSKPASMPYQSVWQNLQEISEEKKRNISKRGTRVFSIKEKIENYFHQSKDSLQLPDFHEIKQTHVESLANRRQEAIETLYFSFIGKALEETQQACSGFSFDDALLALKIAKYFGGVTNKLNDRGDGYKNLELKEVNDFLNGSQNSGRWAEALTDISIDEKKFNQLKKFSALYQKHAGQYFKSARDSKTNIRLTFFPDRFINKLISQGEQFVIQAKDTIGKTLNSRVYV